MPGFDIAAQIVIGDVIAEVVTNAAKYIPSAQPAIYIDYIARNRYEGDYHRYMMGITSPGGFQGKSVAFCQLAAKTLLWVSDWTALREGYPPDIPDPESKNENWILLDVIPETGTPTLKPDGATVLYRISGTYVYGCVNPNANIYKDVVFCVPPWMDVSKGVIRQMPDGSIKQGIINTLGGLNAAPGPLFAKPQ